MLPLRQSVAALRRLGFPLLVSLLAAGWSAGELRGQDATYAESIEPLVERYCVDCHSAEDAVADLNLQEFRSREAMLESRDRWLKVLEKLQTEQMPPEEAEQPSPADRRKMVAWLDRLLNELDCTDAPNPGSVTLRRLNRHEYRNTVRDLLGVDYEPAADFPGDDVGYGFDNIGDVLSLPPVLMERYLDAAEVVVESAIDAERSGSSLDVRVSGAELRARGRGTNARDGTRTLTTNGEVFAVVDIPTEGEYEIRVRAFAQQAGDGPARMGLRVDGDQRKAVNVPATRSRPVIYRVVTQLPAGSREIGAAFLNDYYNPRAARPADRDRNLIVEWLEVRGPLNVPDDDGPPPRVFQVSPASELPAREAARQNLQRLASRAYRRPVTEEELDRILQLYDFGAADDDFENGVRLALQGILVSPHFLFKVEVDPEVDRGNRALTNYELATRLSYFLWSSMPDDELLLNAWQETLREEGRLQYQVSRMLADPKSDALVEQFVGQWLQLRLLDDMQPDTRRFRGVDRALLEDMRRETELFVSDLIRQDADLFQLLDAEFTYVNRRLARHYDLPAVAGNGFQRVELTGSNRGGLLTHGSILTLTSNPTRTSPVKRGKFILENVLGTPPPPPPPDVPELDADGQLRGTLRQRLVQHRENPSCASCHERMDPLGFALENFDAVGRFRDRDEGLLIDATGNLPGGASFNGAQELQEFLLQERREEFVRCVVEKMLVFALGRGLEYYDQCAVDEIVERLEAGDYRFSVLVNGIVHSVPFQQRRITRSP